jgi:hypothetical protein
VGGSGTWSYQAYLKPTFPKAWDKFGYSVAVSGNKVVVGATGEKSSISGVDQTPVFNTSDAGAAYVFEHNLPGPVWTEKHYVKSLNTDLGDQFGASVAVSGCTVIVGANFEDSSSSFVYSIPNNASTNSGAAYIYNCDACGNLKMLITSGDEDTAFVNKPFTYAVTTTEEPTSYAANGLPLGLSINLKTGEISGTPTTLGTFTITLSASNAEGTVDQTLTLTVMPPVPVITSPAAIQATEGQSFTYTITAINEPTSFRATNLPEGLKLDRMTGEISGTPTTLGTSLVTLTASNAEATADQALTFIVYPKNPVITSADTDTATLGQSFSYTITTHNAPTSYAAANLPPGLSLNAVTGEISGKPTTVGTYTIMLSSSNDNGTGNQTLTLTVVNPLIGPTIYYSIAVSGFALHFQGDMTHENVIEYSTDLLQWTPLGTKPIGESDLDLMDPFEANTAYRFYRVIKK